LERLEEWQNRNDDRSLGERHWAALLYRFFARYPIMNEGGKIIKFANKSSFKFKKRHFSKG
jgi:hypothetical protein